MKLNRRDLLAGALGVPALMGSSPPGASPNRGYKLIATEEAFCTPEIARELRSVALSGGSNLDLDIVGGIYGDDPRNPYKRFLQPLLDVEGDRIREMDEHGIDMHLLSLTSPGVQMFDASTATELAALANNQLADIVRRNPRRFAGLASFAPQNPRGAALEIERAMTTLGLNGLLVNSHTNNEYLDDPKFWPIFEAAEALSAPLYIHPRCPSDDMADPFRDYAMATATWGYGVETGTHAMRLILSGLLDRFPRMRIILGHMGEGIPFWLWRIDFIHTRAIRSARAPRLQLAPSDYFKRNFAITTSGQENHLALRYSIDMLGDENVMWAIDHPFQPTEPAVRFMETAPLPESVKVKIAQTNAERIFRIPV